MNTPNNHPNCWPTRRQELLLKASLLQGTDAVSAWEEWKSGVDFERLDPGSERLLPLLYHNLNKHGIKDPVTDRLKRTYLQTWYKNQILFHKAGALLTAFHNAGIPTMMLKGAALILLYYKNYGLRPMGDIDVLVPTSRAAEAIALLNEMKWTTDAQSPERLISLVHGMDFHNASGQSVDLHWHVIHECRQEDADDTFWESAVPIKIENVQTLTLCPADQLLHVFAHGVKWSEVPPFRWVADAMTVINSPSEIDWNRLIAQTQQRRLILPVRDALGYLKDTFDAPIPQTVLQALRNMQTSKMECIEYEYKTADYERKPLGYLPVLWFDYARTARDKTLLQKLIGFIRHIQLYRNAESVWQMPSHAVSMITDRVRVMTNRYRNRRAKG